MKIELWRAATIAVLAAVGGAAGGVFFTRLPQSHPLTAINPEATQPNDSAKEARIAKLTKIYHAGRPLEPIATYEERQRRRYLAGEALKQEDPLALSLADEMERQSDTRDTNREVDQMLANER